MARNNRIKNFYKSRLPQGSIAQLCQSVYDLCVAADIEALSIVLSILKSKIDYFNALIHPIMGSDVTPEIVNADEQRNQLLVGFTHYIGFAVRHTDPAMVAAANRVKVVLKNASYKEVYNQRYDEKTNTIQNLIEELRTNYVEYIDTLQIGFYLDALEEVNNNFENLKTARAHTARTYDFESTRAARIEMEHAFNLVRSQINGLAEMAAFSGEETTYDSLIGAINVRIDQVVVATSRSGNNADEAEEKNGNEEENSSTETAEATN